MDMFHNKAQQFDDFEGLVYEELRTISDGLATPLPASDISNGTLNDFMISNIIYD